ncbi:4-hydroxyphenylacetate 3-monooxygenase [Rhodovarius crocodyli]|uniref:4-hydroxyphenylacetate 3-monooxygenase n=1 Tax=Rhodovarius crocodyli TaxID=1979269 RepID=A0A437LXG7_9PROT|nr:4-hydroxyphenylacetate 3-hydroxylase N-terminal domain-containing protein [Rhodovarius crocodyli]RVT90086.1 4-hydroxyphenylacetate 3-monooxygenase [Rhodovarius crocodyli]
MTRDPDQYLAGLRDGRALFLDGQRVADVTTDPAFAGAVATARGFYAQQRANPALMTFRSPDSGGDVNLSWSLPKTLAEFQARRHAMEAWAELTCGMIGRSPDHVASTFVGFMMGLDVYQANDPKRAGALADYFRHIRDRDLYLSYVIVNPQADKSKSASGQPGRDLVARVVDEDSHGITIRGAKMLATSGAMADEMMVSGFAALQPGDEAHAFTAAVPMNAKGLKMLSRRSYAAAATSEFDYPLSSRFDESDSVVVFEDVKIPWDRVFVLKDLRMAQAQWHETRAHVMQNHQCIVRLAVKLRFLLGLAHKVAEVNGLLNFPQTRETLGLLAAKASNIEALVLAMEAKGENYKGYWVPDRALLVTAQVVAQTTYPEFIEAIRGLSGGGLIMVPSSARDFDGGEVESLILASQRSPATDSEGRVKTMKLVWDAIGSEFASRHLQYEMFYSGASFVTRGNSYRFHDWAGPKAMVDGLMGSYGLPREKAAAE